MDFNTHNTNESLFILLSHFLLYINSVLRIIDHMRILIQSDEAIIADETLVSLKADKDNESYMFIVLNFLLQDSWLCIIKHIFCTILHRK